MNPVSRRNVFIIAGPLLFLILQLIGRPQSMNAEAFNVLTITIWMAVWWISEALPIAATALLPIVLFPLLNVIEIGEVSSAYGHKYIFLYMGGFMIAIAIEKWNLHKRIALNIIYVIGADLKRIILGFMIATAFLSMWISNTATSVMMLPIGMAIISQVTFKDGKKGKSYFGKALMIAIAYSASIGGFATLIGTPPNLVLAGILEQVYNVKITFVQWLSFGLPLSIVLFIICWRYLVRYAFDFSKEEFPGGMDQLKKLREDLGKMSYEEKAVLVVFIFTAVAWISRSFIEKVIPAVDDTIIAMIGGLALFVIPSSKKGKPIINWKDAREIPWGIIILFGGGIALAKGFTDTGLAEYIASRLNYMQGLSLILLILVLVAMVNFLTEITSNLATIAMLLPILAPIAAAFDLHPYMIMVSATVAASCAFMLPVATPPNAVVFGSNLLSIRDMVKTGIAMNIISILLITIVTYFALPVIWDFVPSQFPEMFNAQVK
ncbi:SLC13 family permease [Mangrovivirga sp. M17]|uniref:SLC13 family permease n=1 Tax=Mangrovivirga halotolerans TaxID=2993936 RepID=A0ABT3RQI3_9BACT|nr:SLC13 family permease [Mangrovivirga halotolerans]MCX2743634.1 SLC13 family permease [Mangrovivirga halotolerans]